MFKSRSTMILVVCIAGTICTALLKYFYPSFFYYDTILLLALLLTVYLKADKYTYLFGLCSLIIIILSLFLAKVPPNLDVIIKEMINAFIAVKIVFVVLHIKKLYRNINNERKRMNALFASAKESIILTNSKGEILLANPEAQKLFSYSADEMAGKQIEMLFPERFHAQFTQFQLRIKEPVNGEPVKHEDEMLARNRTGKEFPVEITLNSYEQQNDLFILTFILDLSQHKEAENKFIKQKTQLEAITHDIRIMNIELENKVAERTLILQEALQELERSQTELSEALNKEKELNEIKSRFVSMASHEFRTPLSTILSSASLLAKYQLNEEQANREKHIRRIKDSVKHLNDLLEDFLNLGKLEEGRVSNEVSEFDVKEFFQDVFDEMEISLKPGQELRLSYDGEIIFATDKRLLKNVLINLLSNAIKFSGIDKCIEVSVENSSAFMDIQVKDQGMGIPKEDMPHLFSTFYRGRNAVNIQGTGLGLHIVKRYVDMLEGTITLFTELNEGTTFKVGLPNLKELV